MTGTCMGHPRVTFFTKLSFIHSITETGERFNWIPDHCAAIMTLIDFSFAECLKHIVHCVVIPTGIQFN